MINTVMIHVTFFICPFHPEGSQNAHHIADYTKTTERFLNPTRGKKMTALTA